MRHPTWEGIILVAALASSANALTSSHRLLSHPLSIKQVLDNARNLTGHSVEVKGYFVLEPENRNLWTNAATYESEQDPCISLDIMDPLFNRREEYNRREVYVSGVVDTHGCDGNRCLAACNVIGLAKVRVLGILHTPPPSALVPLRPNEPRLLTGGDAPDAASLKQFAPHLADLVTAGYRVLSKRTRITSLIPDRHKARVASALATRDSRVNWLLFSWKYSLGHELSKASTRAFVVAQTDASAPRRQSFICYCVKSGHCDQSRLTAMRVYYRAMEDPFFCLPVRRDAGSWMLDAGFLLGRPEQDELE